jgi:hypothetical protein
MASTDGRLIGRLLVALAAQSRRGNGRALGHPHQLEREDALDDQPRRDGDGFVHGSCHSYSLLFIVIPGRCEASNPEPTIKRHACHPVVGSGFALSARPGMTGGVTPARCG